MDRTLCPLFWYFVRKSSIITLDAVTICSCNRLKKVWKFQVIESSTNYVKCVKQKLNILLINWNQLKGANLCHIRIEWDSAIQHDLTWF